VYQTVRRADDVLVLYERATVLRYTYIACLVDTELRESMLPNACSFESVREMFLLEIHNGQYATEMYEEKSKT
jgi:hypothetical protein